MDTFGWVRTQTSTLRRERTLDVTDLFALMELVSSLAPWDDAVAWLAVAQSDPR